MPPRSRVTAMLGGLDAFLSRRAPPAAAGTAKEEEGPEAKRPRPAAEGDGGAELEEAGGEETGACGEDAGGKEAGGTEETGGEGPLVVTPVTLGPFWKMLRAISAF